MVKMKFFLIYIDILGFEDIAKKEAEESPLKPEEVRNAFRKRIKNKLSESMTQETILYYQEMSLDSWLLFTDEIWKAFKSVDKVSEAELPLQVIIGAKEFDKSPSGQGLISLQDETMSYLKHNIISLYETWYKEEHGHSPNQTFILLAEELYKELDYKKMCSKPYSSAEFYLVKQEKLKKRLKILEFLQKIGSQRDEYKEIEKLYVEPENYKGIEDILNRHNIVFIIGDSEIGKTYTAVKLLFEFYKEGYEPVYIPEERRREQWGFIRHERDFEGEVVYLEDPWGKVEFESAENLFRDIGDLISDAKRKRCKVIVTSREKVFKEFERKKEISQDLHRYVSELRVNLAYNEEKLGEMLKRYIDVFKPAWCDNEKLKEIAFEAVGEKLRTPMSIQRLIIKYTKDVKTEDNLNAGIENAAKDTKIAFGREIKQMFYKGEYDKLVFLSFPYIKVWLEPAEACYEDILKELDYNSLKAKDFSSLLEEFNNKEIEITLPYLSIEYLHPSYKEAFGSALVDNGRPNNISRKIFSKVLLKLSEREECDRIVALTVAENFDKLTEDIADKLYIQSLNRDLPFRYIAKIKSRYFDRWLGIVLGEGLEKKLSLLLKGLSKKLDEDSWVIGWGIVRNFNKLPKNVQNLLFKLVEKGNEFVIESIALAILENFDKLPKDIRNELLLKVAHRANAKKFLITIHKVRDIIMRYFDKLSEEVKYKLFSIKELADDIARSATFFRIISPLEVSIELLQKLADDERIAREIEGNIYDYSVYSPIRALKLISQLKYKIDKSFVIQILDKLSRSEDKEVRKEAKALMKSYRRA